jgi:hypothetical protein
MPFTLVLHVTSSGTCLSETRAAYGRGQAVKTRSIKSSVPIVDLRPQYLYLATCGCGIRRSSLLTARQPSH